MKSPDPSPPDGGRRVDVAVIGGGITGLAALHAIEERRAAGLDTGSARLYEAAPEVGGTIRTRERDGFLLECGPDAFLNEKPEALNLIRRIGLTDDLISFSRAVAQRSFVYFGGRLYPVPEGTWLMAPTRMRPFIGSPLFSLKGKLRAGLELFIPPKEGDDDESVASFIRRRFGDEVFRRLGEPMVAGIYGGDAETLSARTVLPRFLKLEREYGGVIEGLRAELRLRKESGPSGPRYGLFLSMKKGMGSIIARLVERLDGLVECDAEVSSLERTNPSGPWTLHFRGRAPVEAKSVCLALPAPAASKLLGPTVPDLSELLSRIRNESVLTLNLAFDRPAIGHPLDGFGFVVPRDSGLKLIGCSFSSVKFEGRAPEGRVLLRAFAGPLRESDEAVARELLSELRPILGIRGEPVFAHVSRHPGAMPQYRVGHAALAQSIRRAQAAVPGLALAGNWFGGVGLSDCIREAEAAVQKLWGSVKGSDPSNTTVYQRGLTP